MCYRNVYPGIIVHTIIKKYQYQHDKKSELNAKIRQIRSDFSFMEFLI